MELVKIINDLSAIDDLTWGDYAFARDVLSRKITLAIQQEMIAKSIQCGKDLAVSIRKKYGNISASELAIELGLNVQYASGGSGSNRILFATYTPPDDIKIMSEPLEKARNNLEVSNFISVDVIEQLIIAHEIFHFLETNDEKLYPKTAEITLWKIPFYAHRTQVRANSEIAAMCFSKYYNGFHISPFALDTILYYAYDKQVSTAMYEEIMLLKDKVNINK